MVGDHVMARARDPNRDKAFEIYKQHVGKIQNREIATLLTVDEKKIAVWKQRDKWSVVQQKEMNVVQQSKGAPKGSKNAIGNKGNTSPKNQFTKRNLNAENHGLHTKYLPPETLELMGHMRGTSAADLIYEQILVQYAAIIRSQHIMFVKSKEEMIKELKKRKFAIHNTGTKKEPNFVEFLTEEEFEFQFAWDRQATFLNAQSRAMSEFRGMIKQFNDIAHDDDFRKLKLEQMQAGIEKTKAEVVSIIKGNGDGKEKESLRIEIDYGDDES